MTADNNTVAISGASGHLGTALVAQALAEGMTVRAGYSSYKPDFEAENLTWIQGGLSPEPLKNLLGDARYFIHTAAKISVSGDDPDGSVMKTNVEGTQHVIDCCLARGNVRLVHVSSVSVLEEHPVDDTLDESRPLKTSKVPVYEYTKALAEGLVNKHIQESELDAVIVRPSGIFGRPDLRGVLLTNTFKDIYQGKVVALLSGGYDFVDVRDVAIGAIAAAKKGRSGETYNLNGAYNSLKTAAHILQDLGGAKPPIEIPVRLLLAIYPLVALYIKLMKIDTPFTKSGLTFFRDGPKKMTSQKAASDFGYQPRPFKDSLTDLVDFWHVKNLL
jgi:dihydroflavonol-4-reductase